MSEEEILLKIIKVKDTIGIGLLVDCRVSDLEDTINLIRSIDMLRKTLYEKVSSSISAKIGEKYNNNDKAKEMLAFSKSIDCLLKIVEKLKDSNVDEREQIIKDLSGILGGK